MLRNDLVVSSDWASGSRLQRDHPFLFVALSLAAGFILLAGILAAILLACLMWRLVDNTAISRDAAAMYPGGKNASGVYQRIISLMPPHRVYIEPFFGSGAVFWMKRPAELNIGLDLDPDVIHTGLERRALSPEMALPRFLVAHDEALAFLSSYKFRGDELVYCDPPYLHSTRTWDGLSLYKFEMTDADHVRLLKILRRINAKVILSGYASKMYETALAGWNSVTFTAYTRHNNPRAEWLWFNYPPPVELHDYRYLGNGFRERERIKRKIGRWARRLHAMPILERQALLAAMQSERATAAPAGSAELATGGGARGSGLSGAGGDGGSAAGMASSGEVRSRKVERPT